jgi:hypothetical protein
MSNGAEMKEKTYIPCLRYNVTSRSHRPPVTEAQNLRLFATFSARDINLAECRTLRFGMGRPMDTLTLGELSSIFWALINLPIRLADL